MPTAPEPAHSQVCKIICSSFPPPIARPQREKPRRYVLWSGNINEEFDLSAGLIAALGMNHRVLNCFLIREWRRTYVTGI